MKNEKRKSSGLEKGHKHNNHPRRGMSTFSKKQMRGFHYPLTIIPSTVFILLGCSRNSNSLPDELFHIAGFGGEDFGVLGLTAPLMAEPVFRYRRIVVLPEPNIPVVLLQPGLNSAVGLSDIHLAAWRGRCTYPGLVSLVPGHLYTGRRKLEVFLDGRLLLLILRLNKVLLMRLRVVWICGNVFVSQMVIS